MGHGFFLEDGTEVYNVLDRNLAVQAYIGQAAAQAGAALRQERRLRLLVGQLPQHVHPQRRRRVRRVRLLLPGHARPPSSTRCCECSSPTARCESVDIRTLPFVRFEDNESHCQRRHALNLGGGVAVRPAQRRRRRPGRAASVRASATTRLWNVHWAIHPVSPSRAHRRLDIHNAEYGIWRPEYKDHFYRNVSFTDVPERTQYAFTTGKPNEDSQFPDLATLKDDQPPHTMVTFVGRLQAGKRMIRGTASDNGTIQSVTVNGQPAKSLRGDFSEWEIELPADGATLTAQSIDAAGNTEPRPHIVTWPQLNSPF